MRLALLVSFMCLCVVHTRGDHAMYQDFLRKFGKKLDDPDYLRR